MASSRSIKFNTTTSANGNDNDNYDDDDNDEDQIWRPSSSSPSSSPPPPPPLPPRNLRRFDLLDVESNHDSVLHGTASKALSTTLILKLAFESIGVIYGDVGTSPLYVYSSTFPDPDHLPGERDILGALCLIIYTLTLVPLIKYVLIVLHANDKGNGGSFALYSLICRHAKVSRLQNQQIEDQALSGYRLPGVSETNGSRSRRELAAKIKATLEGSTIAKQGLLVMTLLATCAVIGDGVLTPAISVISAVNGIQIKDPNLTTNHVVLISIAILVSLFSIQRFGTEKVSYMFAPCVTVWFACIASIGVYNIFKYDVSIFRAFNPYYIIDYFQRNGKRGWLSLGGIVLAITGTEAMFADLGHFSMPSVRLAFVSMVYPSLLAAYIGQGAYLLKNPEHVSQTFYKSIPGPVFWPMFVVATLAAIIASQAMISATFSIIEQSLALGCFPTVKVIHTSPKFMGQVYIPEVNWILMALCVFITALFKTTTFIGNAYGIAVIAVMIVTTTLMTLIMLMIWQTNIYLALAFFSIFGSIELLYFSANIYKFEQGGWLPVAFATFLGALMLIWQYVTSQKYTFETDNKVSMASLAGRLDREIGLTRVPGMGLMYTQLVHGVPPVFDHFVENLSALHSVLVFVSVKHLPVSSVLDQERFLVRRVGDRRYRMYRAVVRYGYWDALIAHNNFESLLMASLEETIMSSACDQNLEPETVNGNNGSESEETISETALIVPSNTSRNSREMIMKHENELIEEELSFIRRAREEGVTYMLGNSVVEASQDASLGKKIVVNGIYHGLQLISRRSRVALEIPHKRLMEVGITYTI